jgi:hypothetical protein
MRAKGKVVLGLAATIIVALTVALCVIFLVVEKDDSTSSPAPPSLNLTAGLSKALLMNYTLSGTLLQSRRRLLTTATTTMAYAIVPGPMTVWNDGSIYQVVYESWENTTATTARHLLADIGTQYASNSTARVWRITRNGVTAVPNFEKTWTFPTVKTEALGGSGGAYTGGFNNSGAVATPTNPLITQISLDAQQNLYLSVPVLNEVTLLKVGGTSPSQFVGSWPVNNTFCGSGDTEKICPKNNATYLYTYDGAAPIFLKIWGMDVDKSSNKVYLTDCDTDGTFSTVPSIEASGTIVYCALRVAYPNKTVATLAKYIPMGGGTGAAPTKPYVTVDISDPTMLYVNLGSATYTYVYPFNLTAGKFQHPLNSSLQFQVARNVDATGKILTDITNGLTQSLVVAHAAPLPSLVSTTRAVTDAQGALYTTDGMKLFQTVNGITVESPRLGTTISELGVDPTTNEVYFTDLTTNSLYVVYQNTSVVDKTAAV